MLRGSWFTISPTLALTACTASVGSMSRKMVWFFRLIRTYLVRVVARGW